MHLDGKKVLRFIEKQTGTQLPNHGFLAGQSVCSALLYFLGKDTNFKLNDLDIFHLNSDTEIVDYMIKNNVKPTINGFSTSSKRERFIHREKYLHLRERCRKLAELLDEGKIQIDEYLEMMNGIYKSNGNYYLNQKVTTFSFNNQFSVDNQYKIVHSIRKGLMNHVFVQSYSNNLYEILRGFDINCTQVGIDLFTGKLFATKDFYQFLETDQLKIVNYNRPGHTIIRYAKKQQEFGYKGSFELESLSCGLALSLERKDILDLVVETEFKRFSKNIYKKESLTKSLYKENYLKPQMFGDGYYDKYLTVKDLLVDFDLDRHNITQKYKSGTPASIRNRKTYTLNSLSHRVVMSDILDIEEKIHQVHNLYKTPVSGTLNYLRFNCGNLVKESDESLIKNRKIFLPEFTVSRHKTLNSGLKDFYLRTFFMDYVFVDERVNTESDLLSLLSKLEQEYPEYSKSFRFMSRDMLALFGIEVSKFETKDKGIKLDIFADFIRMFEKFTEERMRDDSFEIGEFKVKTISKIKDILLSDNKYLIGRLPELISSRVYGFSVEKGDKVYHLITSIYKSRADGRYVHVINLSANMKEPLYSDIREVILKYIDEKILK